MWTVTSLLFLSWILFVLNLNSVVLCQFAGDPCYHNEKAAPGVCLLPEQCPDAIFDIKNGVPAQRCGLDKNDVTVCCVEDNTMTELPMVPYYPYYYKPTITEPPFTTKQTTVTSTKTVTSKPQSDISYQLRELTTSLRKFSGYEYDASDLKNRICYKSYTSHGEYIIICVIGDNVSNGDNTKPASTTTKTPPITRQTTTTTTRTVTSEPRRIPGEMSAQKCKEYNDALISRKRYSWQANNDDIISNRCPTHPEFSNGVKTTPGEYPHMALLKYRRNGTRCGGSLISEKFVLTVAHCIDGSNGPTSVRLGQLSIADPNDDTFVQEIRVKKIHRHPEFALSAAYNDIALLELEKPIDLSVFVKPACLYTKEGYNDNEFIATGWFKNDKDDEIEDMLKVSLNLLSKRNCAKPYPCHRGLLPKSVRHDIQFCAASPLDRKIMNPCRGNSGGPLQTYATSEDCSHYIIGVTSFGPKCNVNNLPVVYTKVYAYLEWIEDIVWP